MRLAFGVLLWLAYFSRPRPVARFRGAPRASRRSSGGPPSRAPPPRSRTAPIPAPFAVCAIALLVAAASPSAASATPRPSGVLLARRERLEPGAQAAARAPARRERAGRPRDRSRRRRSRAATRRPRCRSRSAAILIAPRALRPLVAIAGGLFTLAVSISLLILGWHFPSDVVGGQLLATTWALVALAALRIAEARWPARGSMRRAALDSVPSSRCGVALGLAAAASAALVAVLAAPRADGLAAYAARSHPGASRWPSRSHRIGRGAARRRGPADHSRAPLTGCTLAASSGRWSREVR